MLVQLPLPSHIDEKAVTEAVDPRKDVDGFHSLNAGLLSKRGARPMFVPCTPKGIMELLKRTEISLAGKNAVVVGRSNIVGIPVMSLLQEADATVTLCHSKTIGLSSIVKQADVVVAAVGSAEIIKGSWIKPGAVVIDVGINSIPGTYTCNI